MGFIMDKKPIVFDTRTSPFQGHKHKKIECPHCLRNIAKNMYQRHVNQCEKLGDVDALIRDFRKNNTLTIAQICQDHRVSDHFARIQVRLGLMRVCGMSEGEAVEFIKVRGSAVSARSRARVEKAGEREGRPRCESCTMFMLPNEMGDNGNCIYCK